MTAVHGGSGRSATGRPAAWELRPAHVPLPKVTREVEQLRSVASGIRSVHVVAGSGEPLASWGVPGALTEELKDAREIALAFFGASKPVRSLHVELEDQDAYLLPLRDDLTVVVLGETGWSFALVARTLRAAVPRLLGALVADGGLGGQRRSGTTGRVDEPLVPQSGAGQPTVTGRHRGERTYAALVRARAVAQTEQDRAGS